MNSHNGLGILWPRWWTQIDWSGHSWTVVDWCLVTIWTLFGHFCGWGDCRWFCWMGHVGSSFENYKVLVQLRLANSCLQWIIRVDEIILILKQLQVRMKKISEQGRENCQDNPAITGKSDGVQRVFRVWQMLVVIYDTKTFRAKSWIVTW